MINKGDVINKNLLLPSIRGDENEETSAKPNLSTILHFAIHEVEGVRPSWGWFINHNQGLHLTMSTADEGTLMRADAGISS